MRVMKFIFFNLLLAVSAASFYLALYSGGEYKLVEEWMWLWEVPLQVNTFMYLAVCIFVGLAVHLARKRKSWLMIFFGLMSISNLFIYVYYRKLKTISATAPKIFIVSPKIGIQAQIVEIKGIRFTPPLEKGQVLLGGRQMNIKLWDNQRIIAEQPVMGSFGAKKLEVVLANGKKSNQVDYEVRDPRNLGN